MGLDVDANLSPRAQHLLKVLVEQYIRNGNPVGSRTLSRDSGLELSAATVRNVMADLEELGLVNSPHTSAGRIPTVQGYRLFVDTMLTVEPPADDDVARVRAELGLDPGREQIVQRASSLLSEYTQLAGVVMLPRRDEVVLRQVEFLPLSGTQVLVILVLNDKDVENRIIETARAYSASELEQAGNYLSSVLAGRDPYSVRSDLVRELAEARQHMDEIMQLTVEIADKAFAVTPVADDFVVAGQTNLMSYAELSDVDKLRELFEAFNNKRDLLYLLDQSLTGQGVQLFIGEESGYTTLDDCSLVAAPYQVDGRRVGVLGVIGPTRMAYERVIPIVDMTARLLGDALNRLH
jgi:heat-inducible transcriptional repressor